MKVPQGMTEKEVLDIIYKIAKKYRKYEFAYYVKDDIQQECIIAALEALEKYNGTTSLENFLSTCIRNSLLNLKRKIVSRTIKESNKFDKVKKLIVQPLDLSEINDEKESNMSFVDIDLNNISYEELMQKINNELDASDRIYFLKLLAGKPINKTHKDRIISKIKEIIYKYETGI